MTGRSTHWCRFATALWLCATGAVVATGPDDPISIRAKESSKPRVAAPLAITEAGDSAREPPKPSGPIQVRLREIDAGPDNNASQQRPPAPDHRNSSGTHSSHAAAGSIDHDAPAIVPKSGKQETTTTKTPTADRASSDPTTEPLQDAVPPSRVPGLADPASQAREPRPLPPLRRAYGYGASAAPGSIEGGSSWLLSTLLALAAVLGVIGLLRWGLGRLAVRGTVGSHSHLLEVMARVRVGPRSNVLLMKLGHRMLVVSESAAGLSTLADIDDPQEVATLLQAATSARPHSATSAFASLMGRFGSQYGDSDRIEDEGEDTEEFQLDRARDQVSGILSRVRNTLGPGGGP